MDNILPIMGAALVIVLIYGIYQLANKGMHDNRLYRTDDRTKRRSALRTVLIIIMLLIGVFALYFLIDYMM